MRCGRKRDPAQGARTDPGKDDVRRSARTLSSLVTALVLAVAGAPPAQAIFPKDGPNDPGYAPCEANPSPQCPATNEQTYLYGFMPKAAPLATDPEGAAGMSVDRAWKDYSTGRADTLIAYIEGGINWHSGSIRELADKIFINTKELPADVQANLKDYNHDGWISAPDVDAAGRAAGRPALTDANHNGIIDAEDVIARYSDGVDNDHNGYVDDISGWDFYDGQNDPGTYDSTYGHANGQMQQAAAITNNGAGDAGVCPMCMIVPIKAGAEALDATDKLAQAWLYATDIGANVIVSVTADLGYSTFMRQAVEYAANHGVVMTESSNDFDSTDHQGGMWWPHVLPGNGMVSNMNGTMQGGFFTSTFRARSGETSWGTHNMFTVAVNGGSTSESTPTVGGVMALVLSYGKTAAQQGLIKGSLSGFEAVQVVRATASDVADPNLPWPGKPGWDLQYGYGRPNVWKAMKAIHDGDIPPVGIINSPDWFSLYDPTTDPDPRVRVHVEARRSTRYGWVLQEALGAEPADGDFVAIGAGGGTHPVDTTGGVVDLNKIPASFYEHAFGISKHKWLESTEQYTVTLRLRVYDAKGRMGEERRTIFVHHDPTAMKGFPKRIGPGGEGQAALADLNEDGRLDIIFGDADGRVHALDAKTGREIKGWPRLTDPVKVLREHTGVDPGHEPILGNVAVGDLDHDGLTEVVATSLSGTTYVFNHDGTLRWKRVSNTGVTPAPIPRPKLNFTRLPVRGAIASPVLADLNGDGKLDVIQSGWDGYIHAWRADGSAVRGWPVRARLPDPTPPSGYVLVNDQKLDGTPTIADLNGDGKPEIIQRSQQSFVTGGGITFLPYSNFLAYHADGSRVAGWPVSLRGIAEYYGSAQEFITEGTNSAVAADVDHDGKDEIAASPDFSFPYLLNGDGSIRTIYGPQPDPTLGLLAGSDPTTILERSLPLDIPVSFTTTGAFGNFGGTLSYAQPASGGGSIIASLLATGSGVQLKNFERAYDAATGVQKPGFPAFLQGLNFLGEPIIVDVTGDGLTEIVDGADSSAMHAFDILGRQAAGFPKFTTGWTLYSPTAGDLNGDGKVEIVSLTREGYLFVWKTDGKASSNTEWWHYHHDERNTGRYGVDTRQPGAVTALQWQPGAARATFTAPGGDWYTGRVRSYRVTFMPSGATTTVPARAAAGARETMDVPSGTTALRVQAVDAAGNLGMPAIAGQAVASRALVVPAAGVGSRIPTTVGPLEPAARPSETPGIPDWFGLVLLVLIPVVIVFRFRRARAR